MPQQGQQGRGYNKNGRKRARARDSMNTPQSESSKFGRGFFPVLRLIFMLRRWSFIVIILVCAAAASAQSPARFLIEIDLQDQTAYLVRNGVPFYRRRFRAAVTDI